MRSWNLFQKLAFLAGLGVTLHLLVLSVIESREDDVWFSYAPNREMVLTPEQYDGDDLSTLAETLIRIAGVSVWTAGAIWLLAERRDRDDD